MPVSKKRKAQMEKESIARNREINLNTIKLPYGYSAPKMTEDVEESINSIYRLKQFFESWYSNSEDLLASIEEIFDSLDESKTKTKKDLLEDLNQAIADGKNFIKEFTDVSEWLWESLSDLDTIADNLIRKVESRTTQVSTKR